MSVSQTTFDEIFAGYFQPWSAPLPDGRVAMIYPLTLGRARLGVSQPGQCWFEDEW